MVEASAGPVAIQALRKELMAYARPDLRRALFQIANTFIPYGLLWAVLIFMVRRHYHPALISALVVLASLFLMRIFILFHDSVHGSFFASQRANRILGYIAGILTFTPYEYWRHNHFVHHGSFADLDLRGLGDIWTLTAQEYLDTTKIERLSYRLYRHPLVFLGVGPGYVFLLVQRLMYKWYGVPERLSVMYVNLALIVILGAAALTIGLKTYLLIQLPILLLAGAIGVWLFYVQHQFEGVYWARHADWDPLRAALEGCSYYRLPKILQWFTASIGLHHVHHVLPKIPNYRLQDCYDASPVLQAVEPLSIRGSIRSLFLNLWDEREQKLIGFKNLAGKKGD